MKPANSNPKTRTGNNDFDKNRPDFKNFDDKKEKHSRASILAHLGDVAQGLMNTALDKNLWMIAGYGFAGLSVAVSMYGYARWVVPVMSQALDMAGIPIGTGVGIVTGCAIGLFIQWKEIEPVMYKLDPDLADALSFKLGLQRFVDPKETKDSPTLLPKAKAWARSAHDKAQSESEITRYVMYFLEAALAFATFPLVVNGVLSIPGLIAAAMAIVGCELGYRFGNQAQKKRLTARESQKYKIQKRILRSQAEQK
ncbi:hypothetical protein H6F89_28660 [Cyanobacteria bacterium FACHB-63]|nr:hypothetical protein [Cyanobacteria bacterium FACHB-63]